LGLYGAQSLDQLQAKTVLDLIPDDERARVASRMAKGKSGEKLTLQETKLTRLDGRVIPVESVGGAVTYSGKPAVQIMIRDITGRKLAEEAVSRSQKTFFELVERAPFGIYTVDSGFRIAQMNMGSQNGAFRNVRPLIGRDFAEAMHILWPEPVAGDIIAAFRHTLDTGEPYYSPRFVNPRHDVAVVESYEWELHRAMLPDGQYGVICYYFDSTSLRLAEAALKESEEKYKNLVKYAPAAIYEMDVPGTKFLSVNDVMCDILGYSREELLAIKPADLLTEENRAHFKQRIEKKLAGEKIAETVEYKIERKDGRWIDITVNAGTITYNDEESPRIAVIAHDITERKRAEDQIRRAKEEWEQTFDTVPDLIAILDQNHRILRVNKAMANALDVTPEQCVGLLCHEAVHGLSKPPAFCPHSQTCRDGCQHASEVHEPRLGGDYMVSTTPLCDSAGRLIGAVHVARDITARKAAEDQLAKQATELQERTAQLEEANRELESFSYSVSHDLRAPLRAIDGISRIIIRQLGDQLDENARRQFDMLRDNARLMSVLIDNLLAFSRVQKTGLIAAVIDMEKLVREVWEEIRKAHAERELEFRIDGLFPGFGDQALIRQVLTNLLDNAVKFTKNRRPGIVSVTSAKDAGKIIYTVRDNGAGFNMEYADKLFGVFQRLHSQEEFEGTGVGLAIVQRIILRHGGRIWGEGREDEGASFSFSLPPIDTQNDRAG